MFLFPHFTSYIIPVLLLSVALNIPKFLETKFKWTPVDINGTEIVDLNSTDSDLVADYEVSFGVSALRSDPDYIRFYINWTCLITTGLIPMSALIYFNLSIFRGIQMTHERTRKRNTQRASEMNLAAILLCIVFLFIICHFPRILLNVHEVFMLEEIIDCEAKHGGKIGWILFLDYLDTTAKVWTATIELSWLQETLCIAFQNSITSLLQESN